MLLWFILAFLVFPNINLRINVFVKEGKFSTDSFRILWNFEKVIRSFGNSFLLAFSMIITVNIIGTVLVLFTEYFDIKGAKILKIEYMSTLIYSGIVLATGYKFVYGANGIITKLLLQVFPQMNPGWFTSYFAVILIMTFACTSNHIIFLTKAICSVDYQAVEADRNICVSFWRTSLSVVLPALKPNFFDLTILTFLTGLSAICAPLIVGNSEFQTINPMIISFANSGYSRELEAVMAIILGLAPMILLGIVRKPEKGKNYISILNTKSKIIKQKITTLFGNIIAHGLAYILFLTYILPIAFIVLYSVTIRSGNFSFERLTLENYENLFAQSSNLKPFIVSILYSSVTEIIVAILCIVVSRIVHRSKGTTATILEYSMLIPWILPSTFISLELLYTYDHFRFLVGGNILVGSYWILLIAYVVSRIPFALRMIKTSFFSLEDYLEDATKIMGAGALYTMLKVIMPVLLSVMALTFNGLISEYDMTVFLFHPLAKPLEPVIKAEID